MRNNLSKKATQLDVARLAGVSTGTVSRVINNHPIVSDEARDSVHNAIKMLGYIPNSVAQSLAHGHTKNIFLLFLDREPILPSTWQYELPVLQGINDYLRKREYTLQIGMHNIRPEDNEDIFESLFKYRSVDGFIILTSWKVEKDFLAKIQEQGIPTVFIGNGPYQYQGQPIGSTVLFDNYNIIKEIYTILRSLGHSHIAFVKGSAGQIHAEIRLKSFLDACHENGQEHPERYTYEGDYSVKAGFNAIKYFIRQSPPPTAILCANDLMAIGAMKAAIELGLKVPTDISIAGFDNMEISEYLSPSLSTVKVPTYELGVESAKLAIELIEKGSEGTLITMPTTFLLRGSICKQNSTAVS